MKNENGYYFNNAGEVILPATLKGIDVSQYQGEIDWQKAKEPASTCHHPLRLRQ